MKTRKREFPKFRYRECDAFAEYLQERSMKGWHFKEWKFGLVFEKKILYMMWKYCRRGLR